MMSHTEKDRPPAPFLSLRLFDQGVHQRYAESLAENPLVMCLCLRLSMILRGMCIAVHPSQHDKSPLHSIVVVKT